MVSPSERRKNRVPLSAEELFYFIQLKKLVKTEQLLKFKKTRFYKVMNLINIGLITIIAYMVFSGFLLSHWEKVEIASVDPVYGPYHIEKGANEIHQLNIVTNTGLHLSAVTEHLFELPKEHDSIWIGKDFVFGKPLKIKLAHLHKSCFLFEIYPILFVGFFVMGMVCLIYAFNQHLTKHGLIGIFILLILGFLYVVFA